MKKQAYVFLIIKIFFSHVALLINEFFKSLVNRKMITFKNKSSSSSEIINNEKY